MIFAHDTELALSAAAALVNTDSDDDLMLDVVALDRFVDGWGWTGLRKHDRRELNAVRALRPRLRALWTADRDEAVELVNAMLREANALPQLVKHDGHDYHLHATSPDAPLPVRMLVEAAMAVVDVIRMDELDRLRLCAADDCDDVVVDLSKNRSRRFCELNCGNRANVAAYRARRASRADVGGASRADVGGASRADVGGASRADVGGASRADVGGASRADVGGASRADVGGASRADVGGASRADVGGASRADDEVTATR